MAAPGQGGYRLQRLRVCLGDREFWDGDVVNTLFADDGQEDGVVERATNPKRRYVVGRVAKDMDGVLRHPDTGELLEVEPDNGKVLEFALAKVHPKFRDDGKTAACQQNVYNITVIPPPPQAERVVVVDVPGGGGGRNRAETGGGIG